MLPVIAQEIYGSVADLDRGCAYRLPVCGYLSFGKSRSVVEDRFLLGVAAGDGIKARLEGGRGVPFSCFDYADDGPQILKISRGLSSSRTRSALAPATTSPCVPSPSRYRAPSSVAA